jgi:3alpha(or 20beta)-hydroxysteroid dehydrogenase
VTTDSSTGTGRLAGKVAIITGAARGQGEAEARLFAAEGAQVVLGDVLDAEGEAVAKDIGDAARYVHLDVSSEDDWAGAIAAAEDLGPLNVLVNNAGILRFTSIADTTLDEYLQVIMINQVGTFLGIRSALEPMKRAGGGSIVNISSIDGIVGVAGMTSYAASKFGVTGLTRSAALELGRYGIRVNSIHPGVIASPMVEHAPPAVRERLDRLMAQQPIPRMGTPEEVANLALFLASDESSYCTGAQFVIDGGHIAGPYREGLWD